MHIEFLGAAEEVTGSCHLVEVGGCRILLDCGLIQGSARDEARNRLAFPFKAKSIDAVVLSHAHIDHSGRIPLLVKHGFAGPIYTHHASVDLCRIMLMDSAYLNEKDAEWENRKRERKGLVAIDPLYTRDDVAAALQLFRGVDYQASQEIAPGVFVTLHDAGHILGSAIVELVLQEKNLRRRVVFSGDLGHRGAPILRDPDTLAHADLVLLESTYGDRAHRSWEATWEEMRQVVAAVSESKGNVLIPAFAVGRTQELLYLFGKYYREWNLQRWQIFLDSPLGIEATQLYTKHANLFDADAVPLMERLRDNTLLPNLHFTPKPEESMQLNKLRGGAIIIAGSGMCDGGRIKQHLKHHVWRSETHVVIVGYQAEGTPGRALVDGARYIRLWGETVRVAATIHTIGGLSAHAGQPGLLHWYGAFKNRPPVCLVHGEPSAMSVLTQRLETEFDAQVSCPSRGQVWDLDGMRIVKMD